MIKLFCVPYAGGSAMVYDKWKKHLDAEIELLPFEPAGRGRRFNDPFYGTFDEAVEDLTDYIAANLNDSKYAIWGHSMGSHIAMMAVSKLKKINITEPAHVFLSGSYPPHLKKEKEKGVYKFNDMDFITEILSFGGTPKDFFENKELLNIFLPVLRSDYKILEEYVYNPCDFNCSSDITVFYGNEDVEVNYDEAMEWNMYTTGKFKIYRFDGGHFFINDHVEKIAGYINSEIAAP